MITILNPNFDAFLGVGDNSTLAATLSTVALNYTHGQGLSTQYIVPQGLANTIYFAMPAQLSANFIFDVVGYFAVSQVTALDCVTLFAFGDGTANFLGNSDLVVSFPHCSAGYTRVGAGCSASYSASSNWLSEISPGSFDDCFWHNNNTAGTLSRSSFKAEAICCRIAGK